MRAETARQCMTGVGLSRESADNVAALLEAGRGDDARKRLRALRCELMDELHSCQRRVDRLDWLIRETEKASEQPAIMKGRIRT